MEAVAHDGAADDLPAAGHQPLHRAKRQQCGEIRRRRAANRSQRVDAQAGEYGPAPSQRIGERAVKQRGERVGEHVDGQRLLHLPRGEMELLCNGAHRWKVGIDGECADGGQQPQQQ
jgi:hypothetical protein